MPYIIPLLAHGCKQNIQFLNEIFSISLRQINYKAKSIFADRKDTFYFLNYDEILTRSASIAKICALVGLPRILLMV